jgi:hypothetical protein
MGGGGSGSWCRWNRKTTTEESKDLDIRALNHAGCLYTGYQGTYSWNCDGEPAGNIMYRVENGRIVLVYRCRENEGEWMPVELPVRLEYTPCNYGGNRPWFICPMQGCRRRVAVLYPIGKYFGCRRCGELAYSSQQERIYYRMARKNRKIIKKLGGNPYEDIYPKKPKHMHWKTYNRLIAEAEYYEDLSWKLVERYFGVLR